LFDLFFASIAKLVGVCNSDDGKNALEGSFRFAPKADETGVDEININLNNIPYQVRVIYYMVASFEGGGAKFNDCKLVRAKLTDISNGELVTSFDHQIHHEGDGQTVLVLAQVSRSVSVPNLWDFNRKEIKLQKEDWETTLPLFKPLTANLPKVKLQPAASLYLTPQLAFGDRWCSRGLNSAQRQLLQGAILKLQSQRTLPSLMYWGTIFGPVDYTILVCVDIDKIVSKRFFYSLGDKQGLGYNFRELPALDDFISKHAPQVQGMFLGKPTKRLPFPPDPKVLNEDGTEEPPPEEDPEVRLSIRAGKAGEGVREETGNC